MKHASSIYSATVVLPTKRRTFQNGAVQKGNAVYGRRVSKKVHSNINFSELDEVCLDVGKVDLSLSARSRCDNGLSPQKGILDKADEFQEVSYSDINGFNDHVNLNNNVTEDFVKKKKKKINSCYVQLESLEHRYKEPIRTYPRVSVAVSDSESDDWKGWSSRITFSKEYGYPLVKIKENSIESEVLVLSEDLVERECKMLENNNKNKVNRENFKTSICGSHIGQNGRKEQTNFALKGKLHELFADASELQSFIECVDISDYSVLFQGSQGKSSCRKLNFCEHNNKMPASSDGVLVNSQKSRINLDGLKKGRKFCGFKESAISSSEKYAHQFLKYYEKIKCHNSMKLCIS